MRKLSQLAGSFLFAWAACASSQVRGAAGAPTGLLHNPGSDLAVSTTRYALHIGDVVDVSFRFTPEFNDEVTIGPDGHAVLKAAGDLELAGLTLPEAEQKVVLASADRLVSPEVTVAVKDFDRPHVVVAGEVNQPGRQDLRRATTAMQAVLAAGGPKEDAAMGRVILFRKVNSEMAEVHRLNLGHYGRATRARNDMLLEPDDMILVGHDNLETLGRFVKLIDLGIYLQPLSASPVY